MQITLAEESVEGFPLVIASGPISPESLVKLGRFVRQSCESGKVSGAIIDCQLIEGALSPATLHSATPAFTAEVGHSIRVAYINRPPQWNPTDDQFSRDLAYNRGALLELFASASAAAEWLRQT